MTTDSLEFAFLQSATVPSTPAIPGTARPKRQPAPVASEEPEPDEEADGLPEAATAGQKAALMDIARALGIEPTGRRWVDDVVYRVHGFAFLPDGEKFTGHPTEYLGEVRRQAAALHRRVQDLERFKVGGWFCPSCRAHVEAVRHYHPGMNLGETAASAPLGTDLALDLAPAAVPA